MKFITISLLVVTVVPTVSLALDPPTIDIGSSAFDVYRKLMDSTGHGITDSFHHIRDYALGITSFSVQLLSDTYQHAKETVTAVTQPESFKSSVNVLLSKLELETDVNNCIAICNSSMYGVNDIMSTNIIMVCPPLCQAAFAKMIQAIVTLGHYY